MPLILLLGFALRIERDQSHRDATCSVDPRKAYEINGFAVATLGKLPKAPLKRMKCRFLWAKEHQSCSVRTFIKGNSNQGWIEHFTVPWPNGSRLSWRKAPVALKESHPRLLLHSRLRGSLQPHCVYRITGQPGNLASRTAPHGRVTWIEFHATLPESHLPHDIRRSRVELSAS